MAAVALACAAAITGAVPTSAPAAADPPDAARENPQFFYQPVRQLDPARFGQPSLVVLGQHAATEEDAARTAVDQLHASGARAFIYAQFVWFPSDREYQGIAIGEHLDWALCGPDGNPAKGRTTYDRQGQATDWYFLDLNEQAAFDAAVAWLQHVVDLGFNGVFFDRGGVALKPGLQMAGGAQLDSSRSTCTEEPVSANPTVADMYVRLMRAASDLGLEVFLNYGPLQGHTPLRSDARDAADMVLDEGTDSTKAAAAIEGVVVTHTAGAETGKLVSYIKENSPDPVERRKWVFYKWARAKLIPHPVAIMAGDDECGGYTAADYPCWRLGIYPELNSAVLGDPLPKDATIRRSCEPGSTTACVYIRRYKQGLVIVNNTNRNKSTTEIKLGFARCRQLYSVFADRLEPECVTSAKRSVPPMSGRVFLYVQP